MRDRITRSALIALAVMATAHLPAGAGASASAIPAHAIASQAKVTPQRAPPPAVQRVDINSASREQLRALPGIGAAQADKIVAGRPYLSKADLVSTQAIPEGVYLLLKDKIIARQDGKRPAAGKGQK